MEITPRRMNLQNYRNEQWQHRFDSHIAPINQLIDKLRNSGHGEVPYVAPIYGGVNARLLSVLRDPGPMTQGHKGSGFLSMENDDATAETICGYFSNSGIDAKDIVPWNSYPWYINRAPKAAELEQGVDPLYELIMLLPKLKVVMLHGGSAHNGWRRLIKRYPGLIEKDRISVIETYHTSRQAFWHIDPKVREARKEHLKQSFLNAARILNIGSIKN